MSLALSIEVSCYDARQYDVMPTTVNATAAANDRSIRSFDIDFHAVVVAATYFLQQLMCY